MDIAYRPFRNFDPPHLVQVWNQAFAGRGAAFLPGTTPLEQYVFSKPYFQRDGLVVALAGEQRVGYVHAGFGPEADGQRLATDSGVICALGVLPSHRRQGIGSELLRRAETYLRDCGAKTIYLGGMRPLNPFYLGIYGGSELPGVLLSDVEAEPFLLKRCYALWDTCDVLNLELDTSPLINDVRFTAVRRKYELKVSPRPITNRWYDEAVYTPLDMQLFELKDRKDGSVAARALTWEMDLFSWRWHQPAAGVIDVEVVESLRRQGLGKYLLTQVLKHLHDQFFTLVEIQTMQRNTAALALYHGLGFRKVDEGRVYRLQTE